MNVNGKLAEMLSKAGLSGTIGKLNNGEELSQGEVLLIFNVLAEEISKIKEKVKQ